MASDYVIKNFEDIETTGANGIDGRFSRTFLDSTELGVTRWRYEPGTQTPGHFWMALAVVVCASCNSTASGSKNRRRSSRNAG